MENILDNVIVTQNGNFVIDEEWFYQVNSFSTIEYYEDSVAIETNEGDEIWFLSSQTWIDLLVRNEHVTIPF